MEASPTGGGVTIVTLGPEGTCHERAVRKYMRFQGVADYSIELIVDFHVGLDIVRETPGSFLVQCSAHPLVHEITEKVIAERRCSKPPPAPPRGWVL